MIPTPTMEKSQMRMRKLWRNNKSRGSYTNIVRLGGAQKSSSRLWRLKLRLRIRLVRPVKLWCNFKNAYIKMMLRLAKAAGTSTDSVFFGSKRIPKARALPMSYTHEDFHNRLIVEICKSMAASLELGYNMQSYHHT